METRVEGSTGRPLRKSGGLSFKAVAEMSRPQVGPRGVWHDGRDKAMLDRLAFVVEHTKLGDMPIKAIATQDLLDFVAMMRKRPAMIGIRGGEARPGNKRLSQSTINRYLDAVSAEFTFAVNYKPRPGEPKLVEEKLKMPKVREIEGRTVILEEDQEAALCRWLDEAGYHTHATSVHFPEGHGAAAWRVRAAHPEQIRT